MAEPEEIKSVAEAVQDLADAFPPQIGDKNTSVRLREVRIARGLSQRELSFKGCSYAYLSRMEAGTRRPSMKLLVKLALLLDVPYEYLAMGKGNPRPLTRQKIELMFLLLGVSGQKLEELRSKVAELKKAYARQEWAQKLAQKASQQEGG